MIVLVNPITKQPTAFAPGEGVAHIFDGPYQNVAEVSEEWAAAELERVKDAIRNSIGLAGASSEGDISARRVQQALHPYPTVGEVIEQAIAAERERCAKILADYADARAYDPEEHDDLMEVVERIRSGK